MSKVQQRIISIVGLLLMVLLLAATPAKAEEAEKDLFYNNRVQSIQVGITYETKDAKIALVAPSGRIILAEDESEDVTVFITDTGAYFVIKDAEAGQWKLRYDKGSNASITASVDKYEEPIWITQFDIRSLEGNVLNYEFLVEQEEGTYYQYYISLAADNEGGLAKELTYGSASANEIVSGTLDLSEVNTYDQYYLKLYVSYYENGLEYFDIAYSASFSYVNPAYMEPINGFDIILCPDARSVELNWDNYVPYSANLLYVTAEADGSIIYSEPFDPWEYDACRIAYEAGVTSIKVGISVRNRDGLISETVYKTVSILKSDKEFQLALPEQGLTNSYQWVFSYKNAVDQQVNISLNSDEQSIMLNGSGDSYMTLTEDVNDIIVSYVDPEGIKHIYSHLVSVDALPPHLKILENLDGSTTTNASVIITGKTEVGAVLSINNSEVTIDRNGIFSFPLPLTVGLNHITITAADEVGNMTTYTAAIQRNEDSVTAFHANDQMKDGTILSFVKKHFLWFVIGGVLLLISLVIVITLLIRNKKQPEGKEKKRVSIQLMYGIFLGFGIITSVLGMGGWIYYFLRRAYEKSEAYIRLAYESVEKAYDYLVLTQRIKDISSILLIAAAVFIVLTLITRLVIKKKAGKTLAAGNNRNDYIPNNSEEVENANDNRSYKFCHQCGSKLKAKDMFCSICGAKQKILHRE